MINKDAALHLTADKRLSFASLKLSPLCGLEDKRCCTGDLARLHNEK